MILIKSILKPVLALLIFCGLLYFLVFFSIGSWFEHKYQKNNYRIYTNSPIKADLLDQIDERLRSCELYTDIIEHKIHVFDSESSFSFIAKLSFSDVSQGFNNHVFGKIFLNRPFIDRTKSERSKANIIIPYTALEGSVEEAICHEVIHSFVYYKLGKEKASALPFWKQEGYAEYAANIFPKQQDTSYSFSQRVELLNVSSYWEGPKQIKDYFEAGLLVEYLMDIKKIGFEELMDDTVTYEAVRAEFEGLSK